MHLWALMGTMASRVGSRVDISTASDIKREAGSDYVRALFGKLMLYQLSYARM